MSYLVGQRKREWAFAWLWVPTPAGTLNGNRRGILLGTSE